MTLSGMEWLQKGITPERIAQVRALEPVAADLGCSLSQLAIAWCATNPAVTSVITGATNRKQLDENLGALDVLDRLSESVLTRINQIFELAPC